MNRRANPLRFDEVLVNKVPYTHAAFIDPGVFKPVSGSNVERWSNLVLTLDIAEPTAAVVFVNDDPNQIDRDSAVHEEAQS